MFLTTFLGHQGWMFRAGQACLLVDPLLREEFGQAHALDYRVFPPRVWQHESFPAVSAVVLTHEHDDHFDIPSLSLLDRSIPIYLSARSSTAAFRVLSEMGFTVCPLVPGVAVRFRELELYPLVGDHIRDDNADEWDALPFAVRDTNGNGSFFSSVDVRLTPELLARVKQWCPEPGLVTWTNNTLDRSHMTSFAEECPDGAPELLGQMRAGYQLVCQAWGCPSGMLLCGGGFSFYGTRSWLNQRLFCIDPKRVEQLSREGAGPRCLVPEPGQTLSMRRGTLEAGFGDSSFLGTAHEETWPSRQKAPLSGIPDYEPATRRDAMTAADVDQLRRGLQDLANTLAGSRLFRGLYSLLGVELTGLKCTFALVLRHEARAAVFEYNPNACAFEVSRVEQPQQAYIAGLECWGTDLLAVLSGRLSPIALSFGRARLWNHAADRFDFNLLSELYRISHPLRRPQTFYESYRKQYQALGSTRALVSAR